MPSNVDTVIRCPAEPPLRTRKRQMSESRRDLVERIGRDLQKLEDQLKASADERTEIRLPRGFIRTAYYFRKRYWFVNDENLRANIAYALILSDVYRWMLNRTGLIGTAREMLIKEGICLMGCLAESITKITLHGICGKNYGTRVNKMRELKIIDAELQSKLKWLWKYRNREHLFLLEDREYQRYTLEHYNEAIRTIEGLRSSLARYFEDRLKGASEHTHQPTRAF